MNRTRLANAVPATVAGGRDAARLIIMGAMFASCFAAGMPRGIAAVTWGGSLALTNDYLVRGISRSADRAALQADLHIVNRFGLIAGLSASSAQIDPEDRRDVEIEAFFGLVRDIGSDWRGKVLLSHYAYPWNRYPSQYDYDELDLDAVYRDWLQFSVIYSPNSPRFVPYRGFINVAAKAAELNLQLPVRHKIFATGGAGYARLGGPDAAGYAYWSIGARCDLAPVTLALSYVDTGSGAKSLFYDAAAGGRWIGTVLWQF
ncbi:MAG TPA: TorF family putative porin [Steroidobacteraceae bacterium]|nr:TorF family putative porin [Steroidobacteraceae bacterium]